MFAYIHGYGSNKNGRSGKVLKELGRRENKIWSKADIEARNKAIEEARRDFVTK